MCADVLSKNHCRVRGFVDRRVTVVPGYPVFRPGQITDRIESDCAVLIAVHNPGVSVDEICAYLRSQGIDNIWTLPEVIDVWPALGRFWLAPADRSMRAQEEIGTAFSKLADISSQLLFVSLLNQRLNGDTMLPIPDIRHQYFPSDIPALPSPLRFVDCGAYTGDTIEEFRRNGMCFDRIAAFEPDPANYRSLARIATTEDACLFPCGVWSDAKQLRFSSDNAAGHFTANGDMVVQTTSLDQAIPNLQPNYIKMDIEGAEPHALAGSKALIKKYRPRLAISAYHEPEHLWSLLLQIDLWDLDYRFYLRSHAFNGFDTVLYALPQP